MGGRGGHRTATRSPTAGRGQDWTCQHCGTTANWESRSACRQCGKPHKKRSYKDALLTRAGDTDAWKKKEKEYQKRIRDLERAGEEPAAEDTEKDALVQKVAALEGALRAIKDLPQAERAGIEEQLKHAREARDKAKPLGTQRQQLTGKIASKKKAEATAHELLAEQEKALDETRKSIATLKEERAAFEAKLQEVQTREALADGSRDTTLQPRAKLECLARQMEAEIAGLGPEDVAAVREKLKAALDRTARPGDAAMPPQESGARGTPQTYKDALAAAGLPAADLTAVQCDAFFTALFASADEPDAKSRRTGSPNEG